MTDEQVYNYASRKREFIMQNNPHEDFYKTDEYLYILIKDVIDGLKFSKYCFERI